MNEFQHIMREILTYDKVINMCYFYTIEKLYFFAGLALV